MTSAAADADGNRSAAPDEPLPKEGTVVVVGASLAGLRAVETLRAGGFTGRLVAIGEELHLPYDRPPLSKQVLAGTWPPEKAFLADRSRVDELGVELVLGRRAVALDAASRTVELDDGSRFGADGVVISTGASPRTLPGTDRLEGVLKLRTLDDAEELRRRVLEAGPDGKVVVVGAGFIGSEVASTCRSLGSEVTVVEAMETPLAGALGEVVGAACGSLHRANGVALSLGVGVAGIRPPVEVGVGPVPGAGRAGRVELTDGSFLGADVVLVGIGVAPNTGWLDGSGLTVADGVVCDRALFAADGVVAAGDLTRWYHAGLAQEVRIEHWQLAAEQGVAAARALMAGRRHANDFAPVPYFWSDQYGVRIQVLGHPGPGDEVAVVHGSVEEGRFVALYGRGGKLTAALAISRPRQLMGFRPLLQAGATWDEALAHQIP